MKLLFIFVVVLIASVSLALLVQQDPGYVLISYDSWSVETTLTLLAATLLVLYFVIYYLLRLLGGLWSVPEQFQGWASKRQRGRALGNLHHGLLALAEGRWKNAEKYLAKRAKVSETPILNYLGAARAAQQMGDLDKRDHYLQLAHESSDSSDLAVGLTQAELQNAQGQSEQALASLNRIGKNGRNNHYVLNLLKNLFLNLKDWGGLHELLPELRKHKVISEQALEQLEIQVIINLIQQAGEKGDLDSLQSTWSSMPKTLRANESLLHIYAKYLNALGSGDESEVLIRKALKKKWSQPLVRLYGLTQGKDDTKQLANAKAWHKQYDHDPELLLTLGRLCKRNQELDQAREYLESSIQIEPTTETYRELGELLETSGDKLAAMRSYRQGMLLTEKDSGANIGNVHKEIQLS